MFHGIHEGLVQGRTDSNQIRLVTQSPALELFLQVSHQRLVAARLDVQRKLQVRLRATIQRFLGLAFRAGATAGSGPVLVARAARRGRLVGGGGLRSSDAGAPIYNPSRERRPDSGPDDL
jgi:hypothetical protein